MDRARWGNVHLYADVAGEDDDNDSADGFRFPPVLFENPSPPPWSSMDAGESSKEGDVAAWDDRTLTAAVTGRAAATDSASACDRSE